MDENAPPLNPLPVIAWALVLPMIALELVLTAGEYGLAGGPMAIGWRQEAVQMLAFSPDYLRQMLILGQYPVDGLWRPFSHVLVHGDALGTVFSVAILLALGKFVGEVFRWWAVLAIVLLGSAAGALAYAAIPWTHAALFGGWPAVYAMIGGFTWIKWMQGRITGTDNRAFQLIGFLLGIRVVFGIVALVAGGLDQSEGWMWVAEAAAFATGFALSYVVSPGGWQRLLNRSRRR